MMLDGHSHPPRVRPATVPLCLKLGLCLCIKPAKSVSRICKSASRRQSSSTLPYYRRACFRQAVLFLHFHQTPEKPAPVLFRAAKRVRFWTSWGIESALTGAYISPSLLRLAPPSLHFYAVSTKQLGRLRLFRILASAFVQRPLRLTATCSFRRQPPLPLPLLL
jgi:hypothetical protein